MTFEQFNNFLTKLTHLSSQPTPSFSIIKDLFNFCDKKNINIKKVVGVNEDQTSLIKKSNLEIKNLFSKLGIFLIG